MQRRGPSQVTISQGSPGPPDAADTHGTFVHSLGLQRGSRPTNTCISKPLGIKVLLFSMITFVRFSRNVSEYFASMSKYTKCVPCHRRPETIVRSLRTEFTETRHAGAGTRTQVLSKRREHLSPLFSPTIASSVELSNSINTYPKEGSVRERVAV